MTWEYYDSTWEPSLISTSVQTLGSSCKTYSKVGTSCVVGVDVSVGIAAFTNQKIHIDIGNPESSSGIWDLDLHHFLAADLRNCYVLDCLVWIDE